jgi:hypothetical protein
MYAVDEMIKQNLRNIRPAYKAGLFIAITFKHVRQQIKHKRIMIRFHQVRILSISWYILMPVCIKNTSEDQEIGYARPELIYAGT